METVDKNENDESITLPRWFMTLVMLLILFGLQVLGAFVMLTAIKTF